MQMKVYGAVDSMHKGDWDWETRTIEMFQNKSQTCQKSNQRLHLVIHQFFLIVKDQFGPVGIMEMANWDWETQEIETKQKRFKDFLQSNLLLEGGSIHCFLIVKDQFGPVGIMHKGIWDWETQTTETKQKRFKDFLRSNQWLEECIGQCLWTSKAMFGFVEGIRKENWGWAAQHKSTHHRKTTIFLDLLLLEEGMQIIQCFWTMQEIFTLVGGMDTGSWDWETRKTDTHHRNSTTSLQCLVFLVATQLKDICRLWMKTEECGVVGGMDMGNWDWFTHQDRKST